VNLLGIDGLLLGHECRPLVPVVYNMQEAFGESGFPLHGMPLYKPHGPGMTLVRGVPGAFAITPLKPKLAARWRELLRQSQPLGKQAADVVALAQYEFQVAALMPPVCCMVRLHDMCSTCHRAVWWPAPAATRG